jgi:hemolysin activation/secretion protein
MIESERISDRKLGWDKNGTEHVKTEQNVKKTYTSIGVMPSRLASVLGSTILLSFAAHAQDTIADAPEQLKSGLVHLSTQSVAEASSDRNRSVSGPTVRLQKVEFSGNRSVSSEKLTTVLGDLSERDLDIAGLLALADKVTAFYRKEGFPFAVAVLPEQRVDDGDILIEIVEGQYGKVSTSGPTDLAEPAQSFLRRLSPGNAIRTSELESALYTLDDVPGVTIRPIMRPGQDYGTADLEVEVAEDDPWSLTLRLDNHGSRYSGRHRARGDFVANGLLTFGDEVSAQLLYSDENLLLGSLRYEIPVGSSGLRYGVGYARSTYDLGRGFEGFTGIADIVTVDLGIPVIRSLDTNVAAKISFKYSELDDRLNGVSYEAKESWSITPSLDFSLLSEAFGGSVTVGSIGLTMGDLASTEPTSVSGTFSKMNLAVARVQNLPALPQSSGQNTLFTNFTVQKAFSALNASEHLSLGGVTGVRAFPSGEAPSETAAIIQLELRHRIGAVEPFVFYDHGWSEGTSGVSRSLSGAGIGLRAEFEGLVGEVLAAWPGSGGAPRSEPYEEAPRVWLSLSSVF